MLKQNPVKLKHDPCVKETTVTVETTAQEVFAKLFSTLNKKRARCVEKEESILNLQFENITFFI